LPASFETILSLKVLLIVYATAIDPHRIAFAVWLIFPELAAFAFRAEAT
jgi:hypothetical protein